MRNTHFKYDKTKKYLITIAILKHTKIVEHKKVIYTGTLYYLIFLAKNINIL